MSEKKPSQTADSNYRLPSDVTMKHAAKLAVVEDKPILLDYWTASLDKKALIGAKLDEEVTWEKPIGDTRLTIHKIEY